MKSQINAILALSLLLLLVSTRAHAESLWESLNAFYSNREALIAFVTRQGAWGPIVFIAIQTIQVVMAPIPGELTGALAGVVFGGWWGTLYSTIGLALGSAIAFAIGHWLGRPTIERLVGAKHITKLNYLTKANGIFAVFIFFLIPGAPKDVGCYIVGLSPMGFWPFMLASTVARLPGTIALCFSGGALAEGNWPLLGGIALSMVTLVFLAYYKKDTLARWAQSKSEDTP